LRHTFGSGYHAAWFPDTPHEIGAYGYLEDDVFVARGNIRDLKIQFEIDIDNIPSALELNSNQGVSFAVKAKGETNPDLPHIPKASAGLGIGFKSDGSFVMAAEEVYEDRIKNPGALEAQLIQLYNDGIWKSGYRIVTAILRMPIATILISQSKDTKIELSLEGTLTPAVKELGKANVAVSINWESSAVMKYAPARNAMPIIHLSRLKKRLLAFGPRLRTFSMERADSIGAEVAWTLVPDEMVPTE